MIYVILFRCPLLKPWRMGSDLGLHGFLRGLPGPVCWNSCCRRRLWIQGLDLFRPCWENQEAQCRTCERKTGDDGHHWYVFPGEMGFSWRQWPEGEYASVALMSCQDSGAACPCMYAYMYICIYVCMYVCMYVMSVCLYVCMICMSVCLYVCLSVSLPVCMSACPYVCMSVCPHVCLSVLSLMYVCICNVISCHVMWFSVMYCIVLYCNVTYCSVM